MRDKLKKMAALILTLIMCVNLVPAAASAAGSDVRTVGIDVTYGQSEARTMLDMINEFRTGDDAWAWNEDDSAKVTYSNLNELVYDYELEKIAMQRAAEIALSFSHTRPDGTSCFTLYPENYYAIGENIAAGYSTAEEVFEGWQETDENYDGQGHRRNMLSSDFTAVGIGHVYFNGYHYWVQEFRDPASSDAAVAANDSKTRVDVDILLSDAAVSASADPESLSIICGESADLPELVTQIQMTNAWPGTASRVYVDYSWSVADSQYASISDNKITGIKVGSTSLTASALDKTVSVPVTVKEPAVDLADCTVTLSNSSYTYDGKAKTPEVTVKNGGTTLTENTDYTVAYSNNVNAGTAKVTVTGQGDYTGKAEKTFTINKADQTVTASISASTIEVGKTASITASGIGTITYQSSDESVASVSSSGVVTGNREGTATITVKAAGNANYRASTASISVTVSLPAPVLSGITNTAEGITVKWNSVNGAEKYRVFRSTGDGWVNIIDTDSVSYTDTSVKSGTTYRYTVRCISADGKNYTSSYDKKGKSITYLSRPSVSTVNASSGVTVKWNKITGASGYYIYRKTGSNTYTRIAKITSGSTVSYTDTAVKSKNGTAYLYTVRAYSGSYMSSYMSGRKIVRLTTPSISGLTNSASKKMTVTWNKNSSASGYQIRYVTGSTGKTVTVSGASTVKKVISGLTKGKTYKVAVRSYKKVSNVTYYSSWSSAKSVKISK